MESINVQGLPEPIARALQSMVETLRQQMASESPPAKRAAANGQSPLPRWPGGVIGGLTREEIYDDAA